MFIRLAFKQMWKRRDLKKKVSRQMNRYHLRMKDYLQTCLIRFFFITSMPISNETIVQ